MAERIQYGGTVLKQSINALSCLQTVQKHVNFCAHLLLVRSSILRAPRCSATGPGTCASRQAARFRHCRWDSLEMLLLSPQSSDSVLPSSLPSRSRVCRFCRVLMTCNQADLAHILPHHLAVHTPGSVPAMTQDLTHECAASA